MLPDPSMPPTPTTTRSTATPDGIVLEGDAVHLGGAGTFRLAVDADGRHEYAVTGPLGEGHGWDGEHGWAIDWSGASHRIGLRELDLARLLALGAAGLWRNALVALPGGPVLGTAELDGQGRVMSMDVAGPAGRIHYRFADHLGLHARRITVVQDGIELDRLTVHRATPLDGAIRAAPDIDTRDETWSRSPVYLPIRRAKTGHLLVEAELDGRHEGWFVVDTGAQVHVVMPRYVRDLPARGIAPLSSILGTEAATVRQAHSLAVGGLQIDAPHVIDHDLTALAGGLGVELMGVLGFGLFRRAVVEIDAGRMSLHRLDAAPEASWHPLVLDHGHPILRAELPEVGPQWLRLDLGAAGAPFGHLVVTRPHGEALGASRYAKHKLQIGQYHFAGGEVPWVDVGGHRFSQVPTAFALDDEGLFADAYLAGQIGAGLVAAHRVILDYARTRYALAP